MKALFLGTSVAVVVGLWAGGASSSGAAADGIGAGVVALLSSRPAPPSWREAVDWTSYADNLADYVIGTDWASSQMALAAIAQAEAPPARPQPSLEGSRADAPSAPRPHASVDGDILAGMDSYAPPTPPQDEPPRPPAG